MRLHDLTVEIRDKTLTRLGLIRPEELDLTVSAAFNNVSTWTLKLAAEHPLAGALREPGAGIVITGPTDVLLSGPTTRPQFAATATDPGGTLTFDGVDDTVALADALAFPEPSNPDATTQHLGHDTRTGPVESLLHAFVAANIGPAAPPVRRKTGLVLGTDQARGPVTVKSARFPVLGELLAELAVVAGLGFRIVQRGRRLVFETYTVTDRTAAVRLDVYNNTLAGQRVAISPPGATQVIVAGQGELVDRTFLALTTTEALAAEAAWGRRIERFVDQRNTDDHDELTQAGMEVLTEQGFTSLAIQAVPMEDTTMAFGHDWGLGDRVSVVVDGQELASTVTGYTLKADKEGFRLGALIGDPAGFDTDAAIAGRVQRTDSRVSALERTAEATLPGVRYLDPATIRQDTPPEQYPQGESLLYLTAATAAAGGWPFTNRVGTVRTIHPAGNGYLTQTYQRHSAGPPDVVVRSGNPDTGWSPWQQLAPVDAAEDLAVMTLMGVW